MLLLEGVPPRMNRQCERSEAIPYRRGGPVCPSDRHCERSEAIPRLAPVAAGGGRPIPLSIFSRPHHTQTGRPAIFRKCRQSRRLNYPVRGVRACAGRQVLSIFRLAPFAKAWHFGAENVLRKMINFTIVGKEAAQIENQGGCRERPDG